MRRLVVLFLFVLATAPLSGRALRWEAIDVKARLDAQGHLHVVERQRFRFTGDWNGGERQFRVAPGQKLELRDVRRIDASGQPITLTTGDMSQNDRYVLANDVLRWRSRLPTDPEFDDTPLTYEIDYVLSNVLVGLRGGRYLLNHDFAFPDRPGRIEQFTLDLQLDPVWRMVANDPLPRSIGKLLPGESMIVRRELTHSGPVPPAVAYTASSPIFRMLAVAVVVAGIPIIFILFWLGERAQGRFVRSTEPIDEAWLEQHIFIDLPEVIGYMFDFKSGPPEVAAVLARMTQEGWITSSVETRWLRRPLLKMTFHPSEAEMRAQEHALVRLFFFDSSNETDTDRIRKHYKTAGFDPGGRIENTVVAQAAQHPDWTDDAPRPREQQKKRILGGAFASLLVGCLFGYYSFWLMLYLAAFGGLACLIGSAVARHSAPKIRKLWRWWLAASIPTLLVAWLFISIADSELSRVGELPFLIGAAFLLTIYWYVMQSARTKQSPQKMLLRARILAAREWFIHQLRQKNPPLRDEWTPWFLALGLGRNVDGWFSAFGREVASTASFGRNSSMTSSSSSSSPTSGGSSWSGGGGSFGGAGATGTWAAAATSLAAGASAAATSSGSSGGSWSSGSSSGGSSSGGSSSSGGGGGGGW